MNPATLNQIRSERETMQVIKLSSLDGKKRFAVLSKKPPAPTAAMKKLKNLSDFAIRVS